jgi:hypothetical protein
MKKHSLVFCAFLFAGALYAQEVISTQGQTYHSNANGTIDFTVGEAVINTLSGSSGELTQGFQQTKWVATSLQDHPPALEAKVYPNPMAGELMVQVEQFRGVVCEMYDAQGRLIRKRTLSEALTSIQVSDLSLGAYCLVLKTDENSFTTFNLLKTH